MLSGGNGQELVPLWSLVTVTWTTPARKMRSSRKPWSGLSLSSCEAKRVNHVRAWDPVARRHGEIPYTSLGTLPDGKTSLCPDLQMRRPCYHGAPSCGCPVWDAEVSHHRPAESRAALAKIRTLPGGGYAATRRHRFNWAEKPESGVAQQCA